MSSSDINIRPAKRSDALNLAQLIDIAGEGIPSYLWQQSCEKGQMALDYGCIRAQRESGGFSYRNARVATLNNEVVGMILDYPIFNPTEQDLKELKTLPEVVRPFVELEYEAGESYYINALAVYAPHRHLGIGKQLLKTAQDIAVQKGYHKLSVQVFSENHGAVALYQKMGFEVAASTPVLLHPCPPYYDQDVLLMTKSC